jgi:hypothetical protein
MESKNEGWLVFASVTLAIAGVISIIDGIWLLNYKGAKPAGISNAVFGSNLHTYGVIYLIEGIVLIAAAVGVMKGDQVARWVGIISGALTAVSAIFLIPYYPGLGIIFLILGVMVVYALATYGGRSAHT